MTGLDIGVATVVQGGATEQQKLSLALDSGYLEGDYFQLRYASPTARGATRPSTTPCLPWGASAEAVEDALNALPTLTDVRVDVDVDIRPLDAYPSFQPNYVLRVSNTSAPRPWKRDLAGDRDRRPRFDGKILKGDRVRVNGTEGVFTVAEVFDDGMAIRLTDKFSAAAHLSVDGVALYKVHAAVSVKRSGLGNATVARTVVQVVADAQFYAGSADQTTGLFKLEVTHDGERRQTACIPFAATGAEVEAAFDALQFDLNADGLVNDEGHVSVARAGNGDAASGHGYEYAFTWRGPDNNRDAYGYGGATSSVLGSNAPAIAVVAVGSEFGCQDALGPETKLAVTATTKHNSTRVKLSGDAALYVAPGDRIRLGGASDPFRLWTVAETSTALDKYTIELALPFECGNFTSGCGAGKTVRRSTAGAPSFAVRPEVVGRDVFEYDVFFVGPHLADARALEVVNEATGECLSWSHFEGRARDARVSTAVPGGSSEVHR